MTVNNKESIQSHKEDLQFSKPEKRNGEEREREMEEGKIQIGERYQQGIFSVNHRRILMGSLRRLTASFATPTQHMQQGHRQLSIVPRTQTTAPRRDRITATKAKGKPIKNPSGLHSPSPISLRSSKTRKFTSQEAEKPCLHKLSTSPHGSRRTKKIGGKKELAPASYYFSTKIPTKTWR